MGANTAELAIDVSKDADCLGLSNKIEDLKNAIQQTKDAKALAQRVQQKGAFDMFCGSFSGSNTKNVPPPPPPSLPPL